jgi:hypothetical protein
MTIGDQRGNQARTAREQGGPSWPAGLEEAEQLISDLGALVDAGLVAVLRPLGGPVRYEAVSDPAEFGRCPPATALADCD